MSIAGALDRDLRLAFGSERVHRSAPLAALTTFRVGGPADWLIDVRGVHDIVGAVRVACSAGIAVTVLGGGSNVLIADAGVRGLVLRVRGGDAALVAPGRARVDAGMTINGLVRWALIHGIAGLEAWAGTPGTLGGAIHGNAHFQGRMIGDVIRTVTLARPDGAVEDVPAARMEFGYDYSRLHRTKEIVIAAEIAVGEGDPVALRAIARESLSFRKRTQPLEAASAGCIFQNPDPARDEVPAGIPPSAGALVDRAGLKGTAHGGARVSTTHANFIVNDGTATAEDIRALVERCKRDVRARFGVDLREEIVYLGFDARTATPEGHGLDAGGEWPRSG